MTAAVTRTMGEDGGQARPGRGGAEAAEPAPVVAALTAELSVLGRVATALVGDPKAAEDVLEQVAREAGAAGDVGEDPLVWLMGCVRRACATRLSRLPLRRRAGEGADDAPATERLGAADAAPARAVLAALPPTEREALVLYLVGGLEPPAVARACGVDLGTAKTRISRGLAQLARSEGGEGGAAR